MRSRFEGGRDLAAPGKGRNLLTDTDDIVAIRSLVDRYSAAANRLDSSGMAAVYADDGELLALGNPLIGRPAIEAAFAQTMGKFDVMNQICSGGVIAIDADRATGHWTVTEFSKRTDFDRLELFLGNYDDELVRTPDGWRFARRVLTRRLQSRIEGTIRI